MSDKSAGQRVFADALMGVGALMTVLCGGCTVFFSGTAIWAVFVSLVHHGHLSAVDRDNLGLARAVGAIATIVGGLPTALGVALLIIGRGMKRRAVAVTRREQDGAAP